MRIAIIGCGYVASHYLDCLPNHPNLVLQGVADRNMSRATAVARHYGVPAYSSTDDLLADPNVDLVVNLTDPRSHYEVNKASLLAGKHVYSEKPLSVDFSKARELVELAKKQGLLLSSAPCSVTSETAQTLWKLVQDGAVGRVRLVYAELDDNPIYLMRPEGWANEIGAPWPYRDEYEIGCTLAHAGYYLTWLTAMFGPAASVTAFSSHLVPDKTLLPLDPPDTPDFSVACIVFRSGVVARLTCSIVAPYDHRLRIIGNEGVLSTDECWNYEAPVYLERFSQLGLNAKKLRSVRSSPILQSLFRIGGRKQVLVRRSRPQLRRDPRKAASRKHSILRSAIKALKKRQLISMDFFRGVAEMAAAIEGKSELLLSPEFVLHVNELTLAIQHAGSTGGSHELTTSFEPLSPVRFAPETGYTYRDAKPNLVTSSVEKLIARLHNQH